MACGLAELPLADQFLAARALLSPPQGESQQDLLSAGDCRALFPELRGRQAGCGERRIALVQGSLTRLRGVGVQITLELEQVYAHHEDAARSAKFVMYLSAPRWPAALVEARRGAISDAVAADSLSDLVLLVGGCTYTDRRQRTYRAAAVTRATKRIDQEARLPWCGLGSPGYAHTMQMRYFCEALTHHSMSMTNMDWTEALGLVPAPPAPLGPEPTEEEKEIHRNAWSKRMSILRVLYEVRVCPETPPTPSLRGRTARITGPLTCLPSRIRKVLRPDLWNADANALHLAIAAWRWGCPEMRDYLVGCQKAGTTIWEAMASDIVDVVGYSIDAAEAKKHLKIITYSLAYGKGRRALRLDAQERMALLVHAPEEEDAEDIDAAALEELPAKLVEAYLAIPAMRALLDARDRWMAQILANRGLTTLMGRGCVLPHFKDRAELRAEIRSIMATDIQDVEQFLLAPIYELAAAELKKVTPRMRIICPTHDGLLFRLERCEAYWLERIRAQFLSACAGLGIVGTDLSFEEPLRGRKVVEKKILVEDRVGWVEEQTLVEPVSVPTPLLDLHDDDVRHPAIRVSGSTKVLRVRDAMLDDAELGASRQEDLGLSRVLRVGLHIRRALPLARTNVEEHGLPTCVFDPREAHRRHGVDGRGRVAAVYKGRPRLERGHHLSGERTAAEQCGIGAEGASADELVERFHRGFD